MSFSMHAQREANQHASLSNKFVLCHLSARYCNIEYSFSSMADCFLKTIQPRGFHSAFLCPHRKLLGFSTLVKMVVSKCVVRKVCMVHLNKNAINTSAPLFWWRMFAYFAILPCIPFLHHRTKAKMCVGTGFLCW